jgi:hypothetical protein
MPTTDEALAKEQERVQKLRDQIAEQRAAREARERELVNDVAMVQLRRERETLEAELEREKEAAKPANVKSGVAVILDPESVNPVDPDDDAKTTKAAARSAEKE